MLLLTMRDLQYRAVRFVVVILATTVVFALLLLMSGLANQLSTESFRTTSTLRIGSWLVADGVSGPLTSVVPIDANLSSAVTGGGRADPMIVARASLWRGGSSSDVVIVGYVPGGVGAPRPAIGTVGGTRNGVVADETIGAAVGERLRLGDATYPVTGITRDTTVLAGIPFVFMPLEEAQRLAFGGRTVATTIVTERPGAVAPAGLHAMSSEAVARDAREPLEQAIKSIDLIRVLLWIVSALIIGGVIYLSAMERRRDFAVLKAIGAATRPLLGGLALQGTFIAAVAVALASGVQLLLAPVFPLPVRVSPSLLLQLPAVAIGVALLASLGGMRQIVRTDPGLSFS